MGQLVAVQAGHAEVDERRRESLDRPNVYGLFTRLGFVRQAEGEVGGEPAYYYFLGPQ
jgi:hypothetical protein